jgi:hypothetical protein
MALFSFSELPIKFREISDEYKKEEIVKYKKKSFKIQK